MYVSLIKFVTLRLFAIKSILCFLLLIPVFLCAQFTAGNIVVVRIGDGSTTLSNAAAKTTLMELTTAGAITYSVDMPTSVSGSNRILTQSGTAVSEGEVTLSADGRYLVCAGYDAAVNTANVATTGTYNGTIARIDASGNVNTSTYFDRSSTGAYYQNNFRSACSVDGSAYWGSGAGTSTSGGVRYITHGSTSAGTQISTTVTNTRIVNIFNNQLYVSSGSGSIRLATVGTGLPTSSGQTITNLNGLPTTTHDPYSFVFFDMDASVPGYDLVYFASLATDIGLYKYSFDGSTWTSRGNLINSANYFPRGITGRINCNGKIELYITTASSSTNKANRVVTFTDNAAYNATITSNGSAMNPPTTTLLYTAASNYALGGGICFAPTQGDLNVFTNTTAAGNYRNITVTSGTLTLTSNITVAENISVANGATLDCGNYVVSGKSFTLNAGGALKIGSANGIRSSGALGNIQTTCRSYSSAANYEYNGTVGQVTGNGLPSTVNSLTINNTSTGVTMTNAVIIASQLNFITGKLYTTSTELLTLNSSAAATGASNASFVNGPVAKIGNTDFIFPVGKDSGYRPIAVTSLSASETFTAEYFHQNPDPLYSFVNKAASIDHLSYCEFWDLSRAGAASAFVTLSWDTYSCGITALPDLTIAHWNGTSWLDEGNGATTGNTSAGTVTSAAALTSFSPFTLASKTAGVNPLPIELLNFNALYQEATHQVLLNWATASEINNDYFTIEKSLDAVNFEPIINVKGKGNSTNIVQYEAKDNSIKTTDGTIYYRLKQTDFDGKNTTTSIVSVIINGAKQNPSFSIFPNPCSDKVNLSYKYNDEQNSVLTIIDAFGKVVYTATLSNATTEITTDSFKKGIYIVCIKSNTNVLTQKLVIE
jgi:hypothetical protein